MSGLGRCACSDHQHHHQAGPDISLVALCPVLGRPYEQCAIAACASMAESAPARASGGGGEGPKAPRARLGIDRLGRVDHPNLAAARVANQQLPGQAHRPAQDVDAVGRIERTEGRR